MHLDDESLRAIIDQEPDAAQLTRASSHLNTCDRCRSRFETLQARSARVSAHLAALEPGPADAPRSVQSAWNQFTARSTPAFAAGWTSSSEKETWVMVKSIFSTRLRPLWIGVSVLVLMTVAFSFPSVRVLASDLLARFRVQKITVVQVDNTRLSELTGNSALAKQIGQLFSDSVKVTQEPGAPRAVANAGAATQAAGFNVRLAGARSDAPQITVQSGSQMEFVVNRARAQSLLNEFGGTKITLPPSLDGATVKVSIPTGVSAAYGDCPKIDAEKNGSPGRRYSNCIMLIEIPSPVIDTPPDLDVKQLAELGLQFSGMPADQAHAFSQKVDWTSTLVIPIPRNGATYKELKVDGADGYIIQRPVDDAPQYVIVWVKDGIIYAVGGIGSDTAGGLAIANSLK